MVCVHHEYELLSSAYLAALQLADIMKCESIAFPLLASGNNGYALNIAFEIAIHSFKSFDGLNLKKIILVIYGEKIASVVKAQGYPYVVLPKKIQKKNNELKHKMRWQKMAREGKDIAIDFLQDQVQKGLDYLQDSDNREKLIQKGKVIAKCAIELRKPSINNRKN